MKGGALRAVHSERVRSVRAGDGSGDDAAEVGVRREEVVEGGERGELVGDGGVDLDGLAEQAA